MTGAPSILFDLLAECRARGIRLLNTGDGGLTIDAPQFALTPDLLDRLTALKGDVLAMLRAAPGGDHIDARSIWREALRVLEGDPLFPPDVLEALRTADVRWGTGAL